LTDRGERIGYLFVRKITRTLRVMDEIKTKLSIMKFVSKFGKIFFLFKKSMIDEFFKDVCMHILKHYQKY